MVIHKFSGVNDPNPFPAEGVLPLYCSVLYPGTRERRPVPEGARFDEPEAAKAVRWFNHLKHTQGPMAGKKFELRPEQAWVIREAYGWKRADGLRLLRIFYWETGRGNGKSQLGAGIAGKMLLADGELDPEVVGAAATRPLARKYCMDRLKAMIRVSPQLDAKVNIFRHEIRRKDGLGWYEATSSDVTSNWGGAPHCVVFDELHAQPNRELWDAFETSMGKRAQPMMWAFSTAGWDRNSICWEQHERTRMLAEGTIEDEEFFGVVWAAPEEADWTRPEVWRAANPNMGHAFTEQFVAGKCKKAINTPAFQNTFRTMYLSQWVGQEVRFLDMATWDASDGPIGAPGKRIGFGGLDLSSTTDLSAFVIATGVGEEDVEFHVKLYAPQEGLHERARRDRLPYEVWAREGWLTLTPGKTIDQDVIKRDVLAAAEAWDLKDLSYDRWNASKLVKELEDEGVECVQMGQGFASMSAPTKALLQLVTDGHAKFGHNPALRAQASATAALVDAADNMKPDKAKSGSRIDGVVGCIMALDGLNRRGKEKKRSPWEDR